MTEFKRPGGELATRPLHFIWMCDVSGSMAVDGKIQALNTAIREAIPHMKSVADDNPNAKVLVRVISFSDAARWVVAAETPVENFSWADLGTEGSTAMGKAFDLVADQLKIPPMTDRALPPVLVLISDGQPTDDWRGGLQNLLGQPWGKKAVRVAIAIGKDTDLEVLQAFIANPEIKPLEANSPEQLVKYIKWVSTAVLKSASSPASQTKDSAPISSNVPIVMPTEEDGPTTANDVW